MTEVCVTGCSGQKRQGTVLPLPMPHGNLSLPFAADAENCAPFLPSSFLLGMDAGILRLAAFSSQPPRFGMSRNRDIPNRFFICGQAGKTK